MSLVLKQETTQVASTAKQSKPEKDVTSSQNKSLTERKALVSAAALSLNKEYDCKLVQKLKGKGDLRLPSLSTGMPTFDEDTIGCGGIPDGRIIEIYGPESAGKTAFCLHVIACAQKAGGLAALIDAEHALMLSHAKTIGVDTDELIISQPDYGEQAIEVAIALTETGAVRVIVIDSVSALIPKAELEGDMTDASMGMQARLMSKALRKLTGIASKSGTTILFINQVREKIGVMFGNPETTTGGRALKFFASARFEVRRLSKTDGGEILDPVTKNHIGHVMRLKNVKNKVGHPFRETQVNLMYDTGFDTRLDVIEYAFNHDILVRGTKTKENEGNGIGRGFVGYAGKPYRESDLTEAEVWDKIALDAKAVIDAKIKAGA
jgi:recombination protein RecA